MMTNWENICKVGPCAAVALVQGESAQGPWEPRAGPGVTQLSQRCEQMGTVGVEAASVQSLLEGEHPPLSAL